MGDQGPVPGLGSIAAAAAAVGARRGERHAATTAALRRSTGSQTPGASGDQTIAGTPSRGSHESKGTLASGSGDNGGSGGMDCTAGKHSEGVGPSSWTGLGGNMGTETGVSTASSNWTPALGAFARAAALQQPGVLPVPGGYSKHPLSGLYFHSTLCVRAIGQ